MTGRNDALADQLAELAALLRVGKADRFRVRAYERAARVVRATPVPLSELSEAEIRRLEGIGDAMARLVAEHGRTGRIRLLEDLRDAQPVGFGALVQLPLIGIRDARALAGVHGITSVEALEAAAEAGLDDLDERLAWRVRESLRRREAAGDDRLPLPYARRDAADLAAAVGELAGVSEVVVAGAVRRGVETVDGYDLVVVADRPAQAAGRVAEARCVVRVLERDAGCVGVVTPGGRRADLWLCAPESAGAALVLATGSPGHIAALQARAAARGLALRGDGVWRGAERAGGVDEAEVYGLLDLAVPPPELREAAGEVEAAADDDLPALVRAGDLRGDLHVHSDWSRDGVDALEEMVRGAAGRGYEYVAITDHAENLSINGMPRDAVLARRRTILALRERYPHVAILDGAELNIDADGALDYDLDFLLRFDLTVASIHSHMDRSAAEQTERILAAVAHPAVHVIGHPTGRILGHRPGYGIDIEVIAQAAAEAGTALEVNGSPRRLDLSADMVRAAVAAGAPIACTSDAHSLSELAYAEHAVVNARRGWATAADVLNCRDARGLLAFCARKREGGRGVA